MEHIENIGGLEGKKFLFADILVFFKAKDFRLDFQVLLSLQW